MGIWIRRAEAADQEAIRRVVRAARINPIHLAWQNFVVAVDGSEIAGTGQIRLHRDGSAELASIAVQPAVQGSGVGAAIVTTLISCHTGDLYLFCVDNMPQFYRRFGFSVVGAQNLPPTLARQYRIGRTITDVVRSLGLRDIRLYAMRRVAP